MRSRRPGPHRKTAHQIIAKALSENLAAPILLIAPETPDDQPDHDAVAADQQIGNPSHLSTVQAQGPNSAAGASGGQRKPELRTAVVLTQTTTPSSSTPSKIWCLSHGIGQRPSGKGKKKNGPTARGCLEIRT
jgi:hypothetical protein